MSAKASVKTRPLTWVPVTDGEHLAYDGNIRVGFVRKEAPGVWVGRLLGAEMEDTEPLFENRIAAKRAVLQAWKAATE